MKTFRTLLITSLMTARLWPQTGEVNATVTDAIGALVAGPNVTAAPICVEVFVLRVRPVDGGIRILEAAEKLKAEGTGG